MKQLMRTRKIGTSNANTLHGKDTHKISPQNTGNALQRMADNSPQVNQNRVYQLMANASKQQTSIYHNGNNKQEQVVQKVRFRTDAGDEFDTDHPDEIWDYFNDIEDEADFHELRHKLLAAGAEELVVKLDIAWENYMDSLAKDAETGDDIDTMADDYMEHASVGKLHTGKRKKKKAPAEKRIAVHKAQVKKEHKKVATSKHLEAQGENIPDPDGGKDDLTIFPHVRGEAREIAPVEPVDLKGLTKKEINGYEILSSELKGSRIETSFSLLSNGRTVSKPMMVHMSVQRHHFAHMESGEAKELNSLIKPSVSIPSLCNEMKEIAKQVALFWGSSPVSIPKVMEVTSSSGRHYEIDGLTIGAAHAYVTGGTDVVSVSRDEFVCLKAIKDAAQSGDYVSARGILQRHIPSQSARKKLFKLAVSSFQINESVITELEAEGLSVKKSGGKQKGGDHAVHHRGPIK